MRSPGDGRFASEILWNIIWRLKIARQIADWTRTMPEEPLKPAHEHVGPLARSPSAERGVRHDDLQAIEGGLDMRRQLAAQLVIIEIGMQIGQDRTGGFDAGDPTERVIDAEMARVRPIAQRVHNPDFGTGKRSNAGLRQPTQVAGISEVPETKPKGRNIAMV